MAFWPTYRFWENAYECYFHAAIKKSSDLFGPIFFWKGFRAQKRCSKHLAHIFGQKTAILAIYMAKKFFRGPKIEKISIFLKLL